MTFKYILYFAVFTMFIFLNGCKDSSVTPSGNTNIKLIGSYDTPGSANGVSVYQADNKTYALVADNTFGLEIINTTTPSAPASVSNYNPGGTAIDVATASVNGSQYAFISNNSSGYVIVNINNPQVPVLDTLLTFSNDRILTSYIDSINKIAFIGSFNGNVYIYSLANMPAVNILSTYSNSLDNILGMQASNGILYLASATTGLEIVGVSNPALPQHLRGLNLPGSSNGVKINGNYVYMANGAGGIITIYVADFLNPAVKSFYNPSGIVYYGLTFINFRLYTASGINGVDGISVASPSSPGEIGFYHTLGSSFNITYNTGYIYVADGSDGLIILQPTN